MQNVLPKNSVIPHYFPFYLKVTYIFLKQCGRLLKNDFVVTHTHTHKVKKRKKNKEKEILSFYYTIIISRRK